MRNKSNGRFYFKKTVNGNLYGEFSHQSDAIYTESADKKNPTDLKDFSYEGEYYSTWREIEKSCFANLIIKQKGDFKTKIFTLEWNGNDGKFSGEAMLCDDILIGNYWSNN